MDKKKDWKHRSKYNAKAYKNFSARIKPTLYKEINEFKETLGLSNSQLLKKLIDVYKEHREVIKFEEDESKDVKAIIERMKSKEGIWVLGRNVLAEVILKDLITEELKYIAHMIVKNGEYTMVYSIQNNIADIKVYEHEKVQFKIEGDELTLILKGDPEISQVYTGDSPEEEREYMDDFLDTWDISEDEVKKYSKTFEKERLPLVNILMLLEEEDGRHTSSEVKQHPLIRTMESQEGAWFKEENLIAKAVFQNMDDKSILERPVNVKKTGEVIRVRFIEDDRTIEKKYLESDLVFEVQGSNVVIIRKSKCFEENIGGREEERLDTDNLPTLFIK